MFAAMSSQVPASEKNAEKTGIILLAAGGSARMGTPKQLLPFRGVSLLRHAALTALQTACRPVIIVLGANGEALRKELDGLDVRIAENPDWQSGMSGSLRVGLNALRNSEENDEVGTMNEESEPAPDSSFLIPYSSLLVLLCDQPFVTPELLNTLVDTWRQTGKPIAACEYEGDVGVPALFDQSVFAELAALQGAAGAKQIFARHAADIARVPFPQGRFDVDTPADYGALECVRASSTGE